MKVTVYHKNFDTNGYTKVAVVDVPKEHSSIKKAALEYAYRWTQNIHDSWSHPKGVQDKNENVAILGELPVRGGKTFGLRSSMMGDRMYIDSQSIYDVAMLGFEQV
tara:strand:+ start:443 stop:760 length:318 start_codon:yes stop_codon:yes gene_type:complete